MKESDARKDVIDIRRLGKRADNSPADEDYRQILIKFKTVEMKREVLKNSKLLKNWGRRDIGEDVNGEDKDICLGTKVIFINHDETPLTRKENYRLRQERNRLRMLEENHDKKIVISKGKLLVDDIVYDQFKIENQIFNA